MKKGKRIFPIVVMTILSILVAEKLVWSDSLDVWHKRDGITTNRLKDIIYAKDLFVAVGDIGTILTSVDGAKWIPRVSGTTNDLRGVSYQNGTFFALGEGGTLLTSTEGLVWAPRPMETGILYDIAYAEGSYVVVGWDYIAKSSDLTTWQKGKTSPGAYHIIYGKQQFLYSGEWGDINTSTDGINWTTVLNNMCYIGPIMLVNDTFYAVGCGVTYPFSGVGYRSVTGTSWFQIDDLVVPGIVYSGLAHGNGLLVASGTNGNIKVSTNGLNWHSKIGPSLTTWGPKIAFGNSSFVVIGDDGMIFQSDPVEPFADNDGDGIGDNADPDDDNDAMPDIWEIAHGLNPLINDAMQDLDGDGYTNLEEYQKGTDPRDANSHPRKPMSWLPLLLSD